MAKLGDALSSLVRQVRFDKLDTLLNRNPSTDAAKATAPLTSAVVAATKGNQADDGVTTDAMRAGARASVQANAPSAQALPQPVASAQTRLSADAALIAALLGGTPSAAQKSALPVGALDVAAAPPDQVARALVRSLATSGLFYESHLQEWVEGQRPLESLRAEPQQRFAAPLMRAAASLPADGAEAGTTPTTSSLASASTAATAAAAPLPEALAALVREQLDTLDFRRVHWQGEVWPQQQAEMEIAEDGARREADAESPQTWATTLHLDLPHLGAVEARILLDGGNFIVNVRADAEALPALQSGRAGFVAALNDAGIRLRTVEVAAHE